MFDIRPVGYVIGLLLAILGATMFLPFLVDLAEGRGHWPVFLQSGLITVLAGGLISLACANGAPIIPLAHNAGEFWPRHGWGKKPGTIKVMIGPAIYPAGADPRSIVAANKQAEAWINSQLQSLRDA